MKFSYRQYVSRLPGSSDFRLIVRPVITIGVAGAARRARWDALVDTGADETLLPLSLAESLGIELDEGLTSQASGITGDHLVIRYGNVAFEVSDGEESVTWQTVVGFVDSGATDEEVVILGHGGCLDYFTANFDGERAELELIANSTLPR